MILKLFLTSLMIFAVSFILFRYSLWRSTFEAVSGIVMIVSFIVSIITGILWIWL